MTQGIGAWHTAIESPAAPGFGARLRAWRVLRGLTRKHLARLIDCDPSTISRIESGSRPHPERETVIALADALELTGAHRLIFLSYANVIERPLTDAQAIWLTHYTDQGRTS